MQTGMINKFDKPKGYYSNVRKDMLQYIPVNVERVLEFGCGSGESSALVKDKFGAESWAVEIHEESAKIVESYSLDGVKTTSIP